VDDKTVQGHIPCARTGRIFSDATSKMWMFYVAFSNIDIFFEWNALGQREIMDCGRPDIQAIPIARSQKMEDRRFFRSKLTEKELFERRFSNTVWIHH
jgi:hypothetical protein